MVDHETPGQIPFQFGLVDDLGFDSFYPGRQQALISACKALVEGHGESQLYVCGGRHCGKTHILTACCNYAVSLGQRIAYLPAGIINDSEALLGLDSLNLVCIDDVENLPRAGELALFTLINEIRASGGRLVIASESVPSALSLNLPDLVSRLSWGPVFQLERLADRQIRDAFVLRARVMGLQLSDEVTDFILYRQTRDMQSLADNLKMLMDAAIVAKRRITIPFVKEILNT